VTTFIGLPTKDEMPAETTISMQNSIYHICYKGIGILELSKVSDDRQKS